jgi:diguanylate cyclase (GGDEF)-like protein
MISHQLNNFSGNILVVDDIPDNLRVLSASLAERGHRVRCAKNGTMALLAVEKNLPDLILLDIKMPEMDGYEVCQQLQAKEQTCQIPVIFLSALDDVFDKVKAFSVGGVDYITKPFQVEEVVARVRHQLALQAAKAEISQLNAELEAKVAARTSELSAKTSELSAAVTNLNQEIAQHETTKQILLHDALHDALTGLPNRSLFMEHLEKALQRSKRNKNYLFAVLFIDLDRFKIINDSWGHDTGNEVLIAIANLLKKCSRTVDTVARLSGDEFAILLDDVQHSADAIAITERLLDRLTAPIHLKERTVFTGGSIGIVFASETYQNGTELLRDADIAMYRAKSQGKGRYAIFDREMYDRTLELSRLETDLRFALERQELILHYQPIVSLKSGQLTGFEALIRWQHPQRGLIYPANFISIAEETGLIVPIGEWLLQEACQQLRAWQIDLPQAASLHMSINLSIKQLQQFDLIQKLGNILTETGLDGEYLRLEITETMLMDRSERTLKLLTQLKEQNIKLNIDDFGTGYSSLSYLHQFPIDGLKIDKSFVNVINTEGKNSEIVNTIITLAHALGIQAIAEGVESLEQLNRLKNLGCDEAQGYLFAKAVNPDVAASIVRENPNW